MSRRTIPASMRVLIAAYEVPAHGGACTAAYALFQKMQASGSDVHFLNIIDLLDEAYFRYLFRERMGNPAALANVHNCVIDQTVFLADPQRTALPGLIADIAPDVMIGVDVFPASMLKKSARDRKLIFLACGSEQGQWWMDTGRARDLQSLQETLRAGTLPPAIIRARELQAMESSDLVVANSEALREIQGLFYPWLAGKIASRPVWFADWICAETRPHNDLVRPFDDREYDICFIASLWNRRVKNIALVSRIIQRCSDLRICLVGELEKRNRFATCAGFVTSRRELFRIMGNARSVVSASIMDAAPGILFEAAQMKCNVVASKNCGNWGLCHEELLVDPHNLECYVRKIRLAVRREYPSRLDQFLELHCYQDLIDTVAVL